MIMLRTLFMAVAFGVMGLGQAVQAAPVTIEVTVENLLPLGGFRLESIGYTFHDNSGLDFFDLGSSLPGLPAVGSECSTGAVAVAATCIAIISDQVPGLFAAFNISQSGITTGGVLPLLSPVGTIGSNSVETATFDVDPSATYFSFIGSITPSNDIFFGSDDALDINDLFTGAETSLVFDLTFADLFDAGLEVTENFGVKGIGALASEDGTAEGGVVGSGVTPADFLLFDGELFTTNPNAFNLAALAGNPTIARFTLTAVPTGPVTSVSAPGAAGLMLLGLGGMMFGRRRFGTGHT